MKLVSSPIVNANIIRNKSINIQKPCILNYNKTNSSSEVPFSGSKLVPAMLALSVVTSLFGLMDIRNIKASVPSIPPGEPTTEIGWADNVKVLAASSQQHVSYNNYYLKAIIDKLKDSDISNLDEASSAIMKEGYDIKESYKQFSTETPRKLGAWDKRDTVSDRYILLIGANEDRFANDLTNAKQEFQDMYNVPDSNIVMKSKSTPQDILNGLDELIKKVSASKDKKTEVLIVYSGHGANTNWIPEAKNEGKDEGELHTSTGFLGLDSIKEEQIKEIINTKLGNNNIKTYILLNTCYSGAWIAQGDAVKAPSIGERKDPNINIVV